MGGEDRKSGGIQSLARAAAILGVIARHPNGISHTKMSKEVDLHGSTVFHLVKTLVQLGYVRQDRDTKFYSIGPTIFDLASAALDEIEMARIAEPHLDELALRTGANGRLAIRTGPDITILAKSEGAGRFRVDERVRIVRPAHATAPGKILLAAMPVESFEVFLATYPLPRLTDLTITDPERLRGEIAAIRATGLARDEGEFSSEIRCVAVAVRNFTGRTVAALGLSTPIGRMSRNQLDDTVATLRDVSDRLSRAFGYRADGSAQTILDAVAGPARNADETAFAAATDNLPACDATQPKP